MNIPYTHCASCDVRLDEGETNAKFSNSGEYVGLCSFCARYLPSSVNVVGLDITSEIEDETILEGWDEEFTEDEEDGS